MADIYIATTGNDTTGTGSVGNPYQTFNKGVAVCNSGDRLLFQDGTYAAADRNNCNRDFVDNPITIEPVSDNNTAVILTNGAGGQNYGFQCWLTDINTRIGGFYFNGISFTQPADDQTMFNFNFWADNFKWRNCRFVMAAGATPLFMFKWATANMRSDGFEWEDCVFDCRSSSAAPATVYAVYVGTCTAAANVNQVGKMANFTMHDNLVLAPQGFYLEGVPYARITGNRMLITDGYAYMVGVDNTSLDPEWSSVPGVVVAGNYIRVENATQSSAKHLGTVGKGCRGFAYAHNIVENHGATFGQVFKANEGCIIDNRMTNKWNGVGVENTMGPYGLFLKGSQDCIIEGNHVETWFGGWALSLTQNTDTGGSYHTNQFALRNMFAHNNFVALEGAKLGSIPGDAGGTSKFRQCKFVGPNTDSRASSPLTVFNEGSTWNSSKTGDYTVQTANISGRTLKRVRDVSANTLSIAETPKSAADILGNPTRNAAWLCTRSL